jgi:O-antigen/teichoic acid export membrane protein
MVDAVWTALFLSLLLIGHFTGTTSLTLLLVGFGATALVAAVAGMIAARTVPQVGSAMRWLRAHRDLGPRFLVENVVMGASGQIRAPVVAAAVGLAAVGAIRAAEMLIGPVAALLMGISQVSVPEATRALRKGAGALLRLCLGISAGLASVAFAWGVVVMVVFPFGIGRMLLDGVWPEAHRLVLPVMVSSAFGCLQIGPSAGLRALGRADRTMRCQLVVSALFVLLGSGGAVTGGALGAVWGTAIASIAGSAIWWWQFLRSRREHFQAVGELLRPGKHFKTTGAHA